MISNWYNQISHPALKIKRENWQQFTEGTRGKQNEQLFPKQIDSYLKFTKYVTKIRAV